MSGKLGSAVLTAGEWVAVATMPADARSVTFNYRVINPTDEGATVEVCLGTTSPPAPQDRIEPDAMLPARVGFLESTALVASGGEILLCRSSAPGVVVRVYGHTEVNG